MASELETIVGGQIPGGKGCYNRNRPLQITIWNWHWLRVPLGYDWILYSRTYVIETMRHFRDPRNLLIKWLFLFTRYFGSWIIVNMQENWISPYVRSRDSEVQLSTVFLESNLLKTCFMLRLVTQAPVHNFDEGWNVDGRDSIDKRGELLALTALKLPQIPNIFLSRQFLTYDVGCAWTKCSRANDMLTGSFPREGKPTHLRLV